VGGAGITLGVAISMGSAQLFLTTEAWANLLMLSFILLLVTYLVTINYGSLAAKLSVREIVKGSGRRIFWVIVVIIGIAVPVAMMISGHSVPMFLLYITLLCELVGDLGMRYLILKHGYYNPLIPTNTY
jgi:formate-dependent nitrite reductase membrane component NrfD